jgi:microcystin-dependent protein
MKVDHAWVGDAHDGKHNKVTFRPQASDPILDADDIALYGKAVGANTELFFRDEGGSVTQMTFSGQSAFLPPASVISSASSVVPSGFLLCNGQEVSRTTYSALFAAIGTAFGAGNGSTTFNVPDLRGRVIAGLDNMGGTPASRLTTFSATTVGAAGGADKHTLTTGELAVHNHGVTDPGHGHSYQDGYNDGSGGFGLGSGVATVDHARTTSSASTGITINNAGSGTAHNNTQPTMVFYFYIKT